MKLGSVEGTAEEINGLLVKVGSCLGDYLVKPEKPLENKWIYIPAILLLVWLLFMAFLTPLIGKTLLLMFVAGAAMIVWLTLAVQIRFKSGAATFVVAIGTFVLLLVSGGFIDPVAALQLIKKTKPEE